MATLLKNCRIYDGTGSDAVNGSVLFEGDRIIEVGDVDESRATALSTSRAGRSPPALSIPIPTMTGSP